MQLSSTLLQVVLVLSKCGCGCVPQCEPPCISSDAGNESGNCLVGYEPPRMSLGEFYDDTESIFVEHKTSSELAEKEIRNFGSVSIDGDQGEAPYIIQQALQLPSESQRYGAAGYGLEYG